MLNRKDILLLPEFIPKIDTLLASYGWPFLAIYHLKQAYTKSWGHYSDYKVSSVHIILLSKKWLWNRSKSQRHTSDLLHIKMFQDGIKRYGANRRVGCVHWWQCNYSKEFWKTCKHVFTTGKSIRDELRMIVKLKSMNSSLKNSDKFNRF